MNYLAHAYLSFGHPEILVGNMISDFVKGKKKEDYPAGIQKGIMLHRAIDEFTDRHPSTQKAKQFFRPAYRLYAGAFVDVVYDHFLANDSSIFTDAGALQSFSQRTYASLNNFIEIFPQQFQQMFPYMQTQNWLYNYRFKEGMEKGLAGLVRRSAYLSESASAYRIFLQDFTSLNDCYNSFFPELKNFTIHQLDILDNS